MLARSPSMARKHLRTSELHRPWRILSTHELFHSAPHEKSEPLPPDNSNPTFEDKTRKEIAPCERLGLNRTTLFYKMKRLGITPPSDNSQD